MRGEKAYCWVLMEGEGVYLFRRARVVEGCIGAVGYALGKALSFRRRGYLLGRWNGWQ